MNVKKLFMEWGFLNVGFEEDTDIFSFAGAPILQAVVDGFDFKLAWIDDDWKQWDHLTNDEQFKRLIKTPEEKLSKALAFTTKGKGKAAMA